MTKKKTKSIKEVLSTTRELSDGITTEQINPIYIDLSTLRHQPEPLYRLDFKDYRMYYRFVENNPVFYTSVTTLIKNSMPTPPGLVKWMVNTDNSQQEAMERAAYGTFLHDICGQLLITGKYDLDKMSGMLQEFTTRERVQYKEEWVNELKKDALSFAQFIIERNVRPLAVEIVLYHPTDGYAGALDLVAEFDFNKKRIIAIIDLKSGKKGFYESYEIQLEAYRQMWNIHFPEIPIDKIFNFAPKDWKSTPTYNLKDQSDSVSLNKLPHLVALSKIEESKREQSVVTISGVVDIKKGVLGNISEKTLTELVK